MVPGQQVGKKGGMEGGQGGSFREAAAMGGLLDGTNWLIMSCTSCPCRTAPIHDVKFKHHYDRLNYCVTPSGFRVALFFLCGISYSGPYWQV